MDWFVFPSLLNDEDCNLLDTLSYIRPVEVSFHWAKNIAFSNRSL